MPELQIDTDMVEFLSVAWEELRDLDQNELQSARINDYEEQIDNHLDIEECPFCGEFLAYPDSDGSMHWFIRCRHCEARTGNVLADGHNPVVSKPYDAVVEDIDGELAKFTDERQRQFSDAEWQRKCQQYRAMMSLIAIWFAAESWNRRASL